MSARTTIVTLCTALACATLPAAAADPAPPLAPRWGPVRTLAPNPQGASIAVDGRGVTTVAWQSTAFPPSVVVRQRFADGSWGRRTVLGQGVAPQLVADRRGRVTVVWVTHREGYTDGVTAARLDPSGGWSDPVTLSNDVAVPGYVPGGTVHGASDLDVAVNARGAVVVAWAWGHEEDESASRVQSAFRSASGPWQGSVDVTPRSGADEPEIGLAADGTATVVYGLQEFGYPQKLVSRRRATTGRWGGPALVAPDSYSHDVAVAGDGTTVVVFTTSSGEAQAATRHAVGKWRTRTISAPGVEIEAVDLALSQRGRAVVAMSDETGRVEIVERASGGSWSAPMRVAAGGSLVGEVVVSLNAAGDTFVGWGMYAMYGKYRPAGQAWSRRYTVSPDAGVDVLEWVGSVTAPDGDVAVLWDQEARPLRLRVLTVP
jgi:hypothetical protein